jgi:hypothetical protein
MRGPESFAIVFGMPSGLPLIFLARKKISQIVVGTRLLDHDGLLLLLGASLPFSVFSSSMGISGQDKSSWQTDLIAIAIAIFVLEQLLGINQGASNAVTRRRLKLCLDANLLGYKYMSERSPFDPIAAVMHIATALSELLIDVVIISDHPTNRHPSKRASCKRKADAEKAAMRLIIARSQLQFLLSSHDSSQSNERAKRIDEMQKRIRSLENVLSRGLPSDFVPKLEEFVAGYKSEGKGDITIEVVPTQADPCAAKLAVDGVVDAVVSGDSDFVVYVGPNGRNGTADVLLKDLKLTMTKEPIKSCRLYTGQKAVADRIETILQQKLGRSPFENEGRVPTYPIFSGVVDPMVRALLALYVGCDNCPGGVVGQGPKAASKLITKYSNLSGPTLHDKLAEAIREICEPQGY